MVSLAALRCKVSSTQGCSYTGDDPIGVELAGALKNVYAIAAGMAAGTSHELVGVQGQTCHSSSDTTWEDCERGHHPVRNTKPSYAQGARSSRTWA